MAQKTYAGVTVSVNDEGYFTDVNLWTRNIAIAMAKEEGLELSEDHLKLLEYIREVFKTGEMLTIRRIGKSGIVDIKGFYALFPGAPLKLSSKLAGIPKPSSCV